MIVPACFAMAPAAFPLDYDELAGAIAWKQTTVRVYGKEHNTPRLTSWMGEGAYTYSGIHHPAAPVPRMIGALRAQLEDLTGVRFNSVLANLYRDGKDSVSWHSDDEPELGKYPTIASVSIGATRSFKIRTVGCDPECGRAAWTVDLRHGDLLVMSGRSQLDYQHSIPKTARPVGPRINLTFRFVA